MGTTRTILPFIAKTSTGSLSGSLCASPCSTSWHAPSILLSHQCPGLLAGSLTRMPHDWNRKRSTCLQILMLIAVSIFTWYAFKTPSFPENDKTAANKKTE